MQMAAPKKHHYIPQWLSKRWISPPNSSKVFGVTKERGGAVLHGWKATPKAVCWAKNEYTVIDAEGKKDASLESDFYSRMDNDLNLAIQEIVGMVKKNLVPEIDEERRMALAHSLVIDAGRRNPDQKSDTMEASQRADFRANIFDKLPKNVDQKQAHSIYEQLTSDPKHIKLTTNKSRRMFLSEGVKTLTDRPFRYVLPPKGKTFVLGNPLIRPMEYYIVPIDPKVAMVFRAPDGPGIVTVTRSGRTKINESTFAASSRVIATSDNYLRILTGKLGKSLTFIADTDRPKKQ